MPRELLINKGHHASLGALVKSLGAELTKVLLRTQQLSVRGRPRERCDGSQSLL